MAVGVAAWLPRNKNLKENECQECLIQDDGIGLIWKRLASRAQVSGGEPGTIESDRSNEISGVLKYCHALISHRCIVQLRIRTPTSNFNFIYLPPSSGEHMPSDYMICEVSEA
jgi:hypothetical protein